MLLGEGDHTRTFALLLDLTRNTKEKKILDGECLARNPQMFELDGLLGNNGGVVTVIE